MKNWDVLTPRLFKFPLEKYYGTALAQWLRCCATNRKVAGAIPSGVGGFSLT